MSAQRPGMSLMGHYGSEGGPMFAPQLSSPNTPSLGMDTSPGNNSTYSHHIQGLNQDSPMGYDYPRWNDTHKTHPTDMFHIASPPLTPSGVMARSPSSFSSFGAVNSVKRPPLWPMDRMPIMPFPRQTPTPSQASKAANLQHIPCKFFKSGACTAGKNCLFSHNRDSSPEQHVCKYFLKGNCKFGAKCSLSHSFLSLDRKSSALLPNSSGGGGRARLERRASSGAILNNLWPSEPMSPPYGSSLPQPSMQLQMGMDYSVGHSPSQQGFLKPSGRGGNTYDSPIDHGGDRSPFSDDCSPHATPTDMSERGSLNNIGMSSLGLERARQHLAAPLPIRQRSLPDIFRLAPLAPEGGINGSALPSSPFYQPGNKALFLSISCESSETNASSPLRLHSIPELHDLYNDSNPNLMERRRGSTVGGGYDDGGQNNMDGYSDSEDDMDSDQGFLPSSLNDLLTTGERQRRQSRQEDVIFETRLHPMMPSPLSESMPDEKSENGLGLSFELTRSASMATGMDNLMMVPGRFLPPMFAHHDRVNVFDEDGSSPPSGINHHSSSVGSNNSSGNGNSNAHYKERSGTPDPFCPFPQEVEEVQFKMDDDVVGPENYHQQQGSKAIFHAFANMDTNRQRAGLFEQGSTSVGGQEQQDKGLESLSMAFSGGMFISHPNE
ncbi:hypothetical protein BG006_009119 [Podila minutissima]|uniref:C3H1-type domain-containing protein n=1 Tax=Podila minutissima TaxID=64525 RepID=A0A9P5VJG3_9FUNG|nr:hypothetical protein BG006_009119 [Podila minutissima]